MESWKLVLRDGFLPQWGSDVLEKAIHLLEADSPYITQGSTTTPPPLMHVQDWPVEACDIVGFCSTPCALDSTVGEVEEGFARACFEADQRLGEPAACRWFLNWFDDTPRQEVFAALITEFKRELENRATRTIDPALKKALEMFPDDTTLRMAVCDHLLDMGLDREAETFR